MATEHTFQTDVYIKLFDLLKVASKTEFPWGGKMMSHDTWKFYMEKLVEGDKQMDGLERETARLRRKIASLDVADAQTHAELGKIKLKCMLLEWDSLFNDINIKRVLAYADRLKATLMADYID